MNYKAIYDKLIETRKERILDPEEYYETHHIWPKSLGGLNNPENLVYLTAKEHFTAHHLLYKFCEGEDKRKMAYALWEMCGRRNRNHKRIINSRQYEIARVAFIESISGENNPFYGKNHNEESKQKMSESHSGKILSEETKQKMSESMSGKSHSEDAKQKMSEIKSGENNPNYGKILSEETKQKISESNSDENNPFYGKSHSEETKKKMSEDKCGKNQSEESKKKISESNKKQEKFECPHCGKTGIKGNMKRWHFDNCKYKKDVT